MTQTDQQNAPKLRFPGFERAWETSFLGKQCNITTGRLDANAMIEDGQYPFFTCARDVYKIDTPAFDTEALLISGNGANVGYIHYYNGKFNAYQRTYVLDGFTQDIRFIQRNLERGLKKRIFSEVKEGNTPYIVKGTLADMPINLPTLPEQHKIAGFLGAMDEKIAHLSRKKALLEDYKKGCMQQLFSQKIRFKDDDGKDFPYWEEKRLGDFLTVEMGQSPSSDSYNDDGEGLPLVQGNADIKDRKTVSRRFTSAPAKTCEDGDILISVRAPIGEISRATFKACLGRGMASVLPRSGVPDFWYQFLLYIEPMWQRIGQGSTFTAINGADIRKLSTSTPHPAEQRKIADFLSALDHKIDLVAQELTHARNFKAGLLQQMFV